MSNEDVFGNNVELYEKWFETNGNILNSEIEAIRSLLPHSGKGIELVVGDGVFAVFKAKKV